MAEKKVVWIGSMLPEEYYKFLCECGYKNQQASRLAQLNTTEGLEHWYGKKFLYISGPALPAFPKYKYLFPRQYRWENSKDGRGVCVGYLNIAYINRLFKAAAIRREAKRTAKKDFKLDDDITVYVNSPHSPYIEGGLAIKKLYPKCRLTMIIPDLPQYMESEVSGLKKFLKQIDYIHIKKTLQHFDYFILYTSAMAEALDLPPEKCMVMEGCTKVGEWLFAKKSDQTTRFVYSGTVDGKFGLKLLVDSFMKLPDLDCLLQITGTGDMAAYVSDAAKKDPRIQYFGFINDYSKVVELQKNADFLLNMRLPSELATNYCFPSKLFEYMKTGNPVLSFRIGGIPDEYYNYLITINVETEAGMVDAMKRAMAMRKDERRQMGRRAYEFIRDNKNIIAQCKRVYDFVERQER